MVMRSLFANSDWLCQVGVETLSAWSRRIPEAILGIDVMWSEYVENNAV